MSLPKIAAIVALLTIGCAAEEGYTPIGDEQSDDRALGTLRVDWGTDPGCPQDAAMHVTAVNTLTDEKIVNIYDCSPGTGLTETMPQGEYDVWIDVTSEDESVFFAQSILQTITLGEERAFVSVGDILIDDGYFELDWTFVDSEQCVDGILAALTPVGTSDLIEFEFDCNAGYGITLPVPVGSYTVSIGIDGSKSESPPFEATIDFGNQIADLGSFVFEIAN